VSAAEDSDSEKHAFVGLRYWGMENGKMVVSFELRGASIPWKSRRKSSMVRGSEFDDASLPERDYSGVQYYLTFLSLYAEKLNAGRAPRQREPRLDLDARKANALIDARARQRGFPPDAYYGIEDFSTRLSGASGVPQGYLFPFAASAADSPALAALIDVFLEQSARARALGGAGAGFEDQRQNITYVFGSAYAAWARGYENQTAERLRALFRASAASGG
jgi:hypothetical protein